jgi:hypothetical protein
VVPGFGASRNITQNKRKEKHEVITKTDKTVTKHARLSNRYSVDLTIALSGQAFTCEWRPPRNASRGTM